jgi:multidrug efflux pump subunit AcrA (membrane-fusion protein)
MFHDFRYRHRLGAGQCLSEGFAQRARWRSGHNSDGYLSEVFHGRIAYVAASLDPNTRTLQARIETNNPGEKLKKDMYVVATVNAGTIPNAIALPDAAVLRDTENQPFVYAAASRTSLADAR